MPRKPSRPVDLIVFPKGGGKARYVVENLPETKDELEMAIVRKFVVALRERFGRDLAEPERQREWPDFWTLEKQRRVGIEIVEVVNPDHIQLEQIRRLYVKRLSSDLSDLLGELPGIVLDLDDGYQHYKYPSIRSSAGQIICTNYKRLLHRSRNRLEALQTGQLLHLRGDHGPGGEIVGFLAKRVADQNTGGTLVYGTSFPVVKDRATDLLKETVLRKQAKHYTAPQDASLWLLAYDVNDALMWGHDLAAERANAHLESVTHPFAEVWFMRPTTLETPSFLQSVWPTTEFSSLGRRG